MSAINLTASQFDNEVINSEKPVLIDFWASWCGPCRMVSPIVDELSDELDSVKVAKVNIDEEPELAARFGVMSIPTLIVMKNGEITGRSVGAKPKRDILAMLQ